MRMRARWWLVPVLALALAGCGGLLDPTTLNISWVFVNTSGASVSFSGFVSDDHAGPINVPPGSTGNTSTTIEFTEGHVTASVSVSALLGFRTAGAVVDGDQLTVTAVWNGTELSVVAAGGCASATAPPGSLLGASVCTAPKTWKLDGITGTATGNFQDIAATASGTLTFNVPQTVEEGETYAVSATFSGSLTVNPGWNGYSTNATVGITELWSGLNAVNSTNTGPVTGTKSQSATANGAWTVPKNRPTLSVEAGGNFTMAGTGAHLVATYSKVP